MPTQTEAHLQVIADKIDTIKSLQQSPAGAIPPTDILTITEELQSIGNIVHQLPAEFRGRYSKVSWEKIEHWASTNTFVSGLTDQQLVDMICDLNKAKAEIRRHAFPDVTTQRLVIESLNSTFAKLSEEWYGHAKNPFYLVSFTAILAIARANFISPGINLNYLEYAAYFWHAIAVAIIILELQQSKGVTYVYFSSMQNFNTETELFDVQVKLKEEEIINIKNMLMKRKVKRRLSSFLWFITLYFAIIVTLITS